MDGRKGVEAFDDLYTVGMQPPRTSKKLQSDGTAGARELHFGSTPKDLAPQPLRYWPSNLYIDSDA